MSRPADHRARRSNLTRVIGCAIGFVTIGFLAWTVVTQWQDLSGADIRFAPAWFVPALLALLICQATQGELARLIVIGLGSRVAPWRMRAIYGAGLLARYVPSGALTIVVRIKLEQRAGVPQRVATVGLLYEFAVGISAAAVVSAALLFRISFALGLAGIALTPAIVGIMLHPRVFFAVADRVLTRLGRPTAARPLPLRTVSALTALCAVSFIFNGLGVLCVVAAVTTIPDGAVVVIIASAGIAFVASMFGFALPAGLGAREAGLALSLGIVLAGPLAVTIAVICRLLQTAVEVLYAAVGAACDRRRRRIAGEPCCQDGGADGGSGA